MPVYQVPFVTDAKPYAGIAAGEAGYHLVQRDRVWELEAPDETVVAAFEAWYNGFNDVGYARARAKERLAEELSLRLNAAEVQGMQITLMMRVLRLAVKNSGTVFNAWPVIDRSKVNSANARLIKIDNIGDAAELIGADIDALTDSYAISAFDVVNSARWPAI